MAQQVIGAKIRERRRALGVKQSDLAQTMGISPSYLNLIERNRRNIAGALLKSAAEALNLRLDELDGAEERRLVDRLSAIAAEPEFRGLGADPATVGELIGRFPGWARLLAGAGEGHRERGALVEALSDRLTHDPFLSDAVHRMLTNIAAIRSTSEILDSVDDIDPAQRRRFYDILMLESARLAEVAESLAQFFDKAHEQAGPSAPGEEVEALFLDAGNRFEPLERPRGAPEDVLAAAGVEIVESPGVAETGFDGRRLALPLAAPERERRQAMAEAAANLALGAEIDAVIAARSDLAGEAARRRAARALTEYAGDALIAPYEAFHAAGEAFRWDVDALAGRFGAGFDHAARRMTTMTRPGMAGPPAAYMKVNAAGFALNRRMLGELSLPRYGAACPLWAVYRAMSTPGQTIRQLAEFPTGERYLFIARADTVGAARFGAPAHRRATLLALPADAAADTVYATSLRESVEPVGSNCRICARAACLHRAEDPVFG
jgi:predicted transcriptional regulator/transcriptional regulator with XRE-family HTH domain